MKIMSPPLVTIALLILVLYFLKKLIKHVRIMVNVHKLPGPERYNWFLGNIFHLHDTRENIHKIPREWSLQHYPLYKIWIGYTVGVCCFGPEDFELILTSMKHIDKGPVYRILHDWLGTGLLTSSGHKWQTRRKILTPAFHFSILQQFIRIFNEETSSFVEILRRECHKPHVAVSPLISQFTLRTIGETAMGTKFDFKSAREMTYRSAVHAMGDVVVYKFIRAYLFENPLTEFVYRCTPMYITETKLVKTLHSFTKGVIEDKQKNVGTGNEIDSTSDDNELWLSKKKRLAMLDLLLSVKKDEGMIDDEGIREEVDTFMFEGHDTVSMSIGFTLMLLACHKDFQNQIVHEMTEILGDIKKTPTYDDLQQLKYMERCIKESLRLYPSVGYISRQLGEDIVTSTGHRLLKDTVMHLLIYDLHHSPEVYPDPEKFDPDRFLPENTQKRHPFAYVPFSAGPRNCIGQRFAMLEIKALLCGILGNFILEPVDTPETVVILGDIVLRPKENIKVKFVPRSSSP